MWNLIPEYNFIKLGCTRLKRSGKFVSETANMVLYRTFNGQLCTSRPSKLMLNEYALYRCGHSSDCRTTVCCRRSFRTRVFERCRLLWPSEHHLAEMQWNGLTKMWIWACCYVKCLPTNVTFIASQFRIKANCDHVHTAFVSSFGLLHFQLDNIYNKYCTNVPHKRDKICYLSCAFWVLAQKNYFRVIDLYMLTV